MNFLLFTNLFPSSREPSRGVFNLNGFHPLTRSSRVRVVSPVPWWRRVRDPRALLSLPKESWLDLQATYPTVWTAPRIHHRMQPALVYRSVRRHVRDLHREEPIDAVIGSFAYPDTVVAAWLARDLGCPLIALVLGSDMNVLAQQPQLRPMIRDALSQASLVVALSAGLRDKVVELGIPDERVVVQHNGVDGERFRIRDKAEARRALKLSAAGSMVCFVGNLVEEKGPDVLLEAMALMGPDVHLNVVGDGNLRPALVSSAKRLGISDRVTFAGRRNPQEIPLWMSAADVLCLPSRREGCPNVVLEAFASGRPVVASAVGGVPELLSDANGIMVPAQDPAALAAALTDAFSRTWNPVEIRSAVAGLTWEAFSDVFHGAIAVRRETAPARALG